MEEEEKKRARMELCCHPTAITSTILVLVLIFSTTSENNLNSDAFQCSRRRITRPSRLSLNLNLKSSSQLLMAVDPDSDNVTKETSWDRIAGPKLFKTVTNWNGIHSVPLVPLRILTGLLMIHHGSEGGLLPANFGTAEFQGFMDYIMVPYFGFLPGSLEFWAAMHDYVEFFGGIFLSIGFLTRPVALSLLGTMLSAVYFHLSSTGTQGFPFGHVSNYSYDFEEPLLYALIFSLFWFNGSGPLSIDSIIYKNIAPDDDK